MYNDILVPTDGSAGSNSVVAHAVELAKSTGARLHLLFVVNTTYTTYGATGNTALEQVRTHGTAAVEELAADIEAEGIETETIIEEGDPYEKIIDYAEANTDLIIMATRGRTGLDRYLVGSVTERVVRLSDVPVLTIQTPKGGD